MAEAAEPEAAAPVNFLVGGGDTFAVARYGLSMILVAGVLGGLAVASRPLPASDDVSDADDAVMVDLPPAEASSRPASDAEAGPPQDAQQASASAPVPESDPAKPLEVAPSPPQPDPDAVLQRKSEVEPPAAVAAPAATEQQALAPPGSVTPATKDAADDEPGRPHASTHAITLWQRTLLRRLEGAKRHLARARRGVGSVKVAFEIDGTGALVFVHVLKTSGSASLDRAAVMIVRTAAPFPPPPLGSQRRVRSFIVPINFR